MLARAGRCGAIAAGEIGSSGLEGENQCPTVPVALRRDDLTQPETWLPVLGLEYITDDQPSFDHRDIFGDGLGLPAIGKSRTRYREDEGNQDRSGRHGLAPHAARQAFLSWQAFLASKGPAEGCQQGLRDGSPEGLDHQVEQK